MYYNSCTDIYECEVYKYEKENAWKNRFVRE